ncbi:MAG: hypothetical protein H6719_12940 [Sandaracinaceae bacterium]|nr:hypothetical protein [Sandaracinaceae bacterium]
MRWTVRLAHSLCLAALLGGVSIACGSDPAPTPEVTPEPARPDPVHVPPPEDEDLPSAQPSTEAWREPAAPEHLRVLHRSRDGLSWDEVEHPDPAMRRRLASLAREVSHAWRSRHFSSLGCEVSLAHPTVVSFRCHAREQYRRTTSATSALHVAIADGQLFPFEAADVLGPRETIGGLTRGDCRRQHRAQVREQPQVEAACDPERAVAVLGPDGLHVHYPMVGTADTIDVVVPFTSEAKFRDGGPLAGLRAGGTPEPLPVTTGPWAVSWAGTAAEVVPGIDAVPAARRDELRLEGAPGGVVRYVLAEDASAEDAASMAALLGSEARRVAARSELRPVTRRVSTKATTVLAADGAAVLPAGTHVWTVDPHPGELRDLREPPLAYTGVASGGFREADFAPDTGCTPAAPGEGDALAATTTAFVSGRREDVAVFARVDGEELEVAVHHLGARCAVGEAIQTVRVTGRYEDVRLGSTEADGGVGLLVVGYRVADEPRARYRVHRLGDDEPLLTAERPIRSSAESFLRLGETLGETYFPLTVSHHEDYAGDVEPEDYPVRRFTWRDGRLVESSGA